MALSFNNSSKAQVGDYILCRGKLVRIGKIYDSFYEEDFGWYIEGADESGRYFYWKQGFDGGDYMKGGAVLKRFPYTGVNYAVRMEGYTRWRPAGGTEYELRRTIERIWRMGRRVAEIATIADEITMY